MRGPQSIAYAFNRLVDGSLWLTIILFFTALIPLSAQSVPDYNWLKGVDLGSAGIFSLNNIAISVDADSKGNVYVLTFGGSLKKYDKNGNSMGVISLNAELESPVDLAINSKDEFFVADHEKRIVYAFDLNGNLLTGKSKTSGYFKPLGITFDKDDNLYVLDYNDGSGAEDTQSSRLKIYYSNGSASDDLLVNYLTQPYRIAVDSKGSIYISHVGDDEKGEVLVFNSDYQFIEVLQGMGSPGSIEIDAFDFIHVMDYSNKLNLSKILSRDIGYLFGAIGEIQNGIEENEFSIKIYDVTRNLIKTFKEEIDLPLDVAFGFCANKMYVNNARITDSSELQFDLEIYERTLSFDTQNPVLTCLGDFTVFLPAGQNHITLSFSSARVSDNCSATVTQTEGPSSGSQVTAGNYEIKFTAEDEAGNTSVCSFFILVAEEDSEKEANFNNCPSEISTVTDPNDCGAIVSYNAPTASEGGDDLEVTRTSGLDPGSLFPVGITTVTYEATASDGEILTCSFDVVVTDNQAPEISCPADIEVTAQPGEDFAVVDFPDATATDNCSVTIVQTSGLSSGSEFEIGTHIIEFTATDPSGKTDVCSFKITVKEPESPSFECPAEEGLPVLELDQNCGLTIPDYDYLLTSFENFQNEEFLVQSQVRVGNLLEVTIEVYDGEGGAFVNSCEFDIQIVDSIEPTIECPGSPPIHCNEWRREIHPP